MKKLKIIFNLITLALTTGLLVMITLAWYAVNKQASVEAGTGSVADLDNIVDTVEYYNFKSAGVPDENTSVVTYTTRQYVKHQYGKNEDWTQIRYFNNDDSAASGEVAGYDNKFQMNKFDYLKQGFSKYLIKITLKQDKSLSDLQFLSTATYFIGYSSEGGNGSVQAVDNLSMSSVIQFGRLTNTPSISEDHSTVAFKDNAVYQHFDFTNNNLEYSGAISTSKKSIASNVAPVSAGSSVELYILVDYNLDALNAFYGNNLYTSGTWGKGEGHGKAEAPQFNVLDFKIFILG